MCGGVKLWLAQVLEQVVCDLFRFTPPGLDGGRPQGNFAQHG
jgi:hypothetical protein